MAAVVSPIDSPAEQRHEQYLIQRVLRGDTECFYELIEPYEQRLFTILVSILGNSADAEDAAQEAVLKAFKHLWQFRGGAKFSTWLTQIAINEARMLKRKKHADRLVPVPSHEEQEKDYIPHEFADWREIPLETLERKEIQESLSQALASIGQIYREVFVLRDMQQLSIEETSKALGISISAVKTRLLRARLMLRDLLSPRFRAALNSNLFRTKGARLW